MLIKIDDNRKRLKEIPSSVIGIQKDFDHLFIVVISNQNAKILRFFNYFIFFSFFIFVSMTSPRKILEITAIFDPYRMQ